MEIPTEWPPDLGGGGPGSGGLPSLEWLSIVQIFSAEIQAVDVWYHFLQHESTRRRAQAVGYGLTFLKVSPIILIWALYQGFDFINSITTAAEGLRPSNAAADYYWTGPGFVQYA